MATFNQNTTWNVTVEKKAVTGFSVYKEALVRKEPLLGNKKTANKKGKTATKKRRRRLMTVRKQKAIPAGSRPVCVVCEVGNQAGRVDYVLAAITSVAAP